MVSLTRISKNEVSHMSAMFYISGWNLQAPSNDEKSLRKIPLITTVRRPPWVKWRPPRPCPPPREFLNTLLSLSILRHLMQRNRLKRKTKKPTWHHSGVISRQPMVGIPTKFVFVGTYIGTLVQIHEEVDQK